MLGSGVSPLVMANAARISPAFSMKVMNHPTAMKNPPTRKPRKRLSIDPTITWRRMLKTICTPKMIRTMTMIWPMYWTNLFQP